MRVPRRRVFASLATLTLVGELLAFGVHGTFASYNSSLTNLGSNASAGTLTLSTMANSPTGTMCLSSGSATNSNTGCGAITLSGGPFRPGTTATVKLRIVNSGSLNAGDLSVWAPKTCSGTTTICTVLELTIQETTSTGANIKCFYPTTNTACVATSGKDLASFRTTHRTQATKLTLTGGLNALTSRFFTVGVTLPTFSSPATGNVYQGKTAKFSIQWYLNETGP